MGSNRICKLLHCFNICVWCVNYNFYYHSNDEKCHLMTLNTMCHPQKLAQCGLFYSPCFQLFGWWTVSVDPAVFFHLHLQQLSSRYQCPKRWKSSLAAIKTRSRYENILSWNCHMWTYLFTTHFIAFYAPEESKTASNLFTLSQEKLGLVFSKY